ncbi:hypothetical protein K431DRAFT_302906 [Polychaeton citri CBS 116435]|uniref:Uncharacterized protein n=1 Tax=Polychaeton citri CBS 116435 TaxID=1314669 RepID=A0A9P4QBS2_9PEZI|nr:hypothetical protein K431DRAFT_302906 [Polychaeton citri CBS 116435]
MRSEEGIEVFLRLKSGKGKNLQSTTAQKLRHDISIWVIEGGIDKENQPQRVYVNKGEATSYYEIVNVQSTFTDSGAGRPVGLNMPDEQKFNFTPPPFVFQEDRPRCAPKGCIHVVVAFGEVAVRPSFHKLRLYDLIAVKSDSHIILVSSICGTWFKPVLHPVCFEFVNGSPACDGQAVASRKYRPVRKARSEIFQVQPTLTYYFQQRPRRTGYGHFDEISIEKRSQKRSSPHNGAMTELDGEVERSSLETQLQAQTGAAIELDGEGEESPIEKPLQAQNGQGHSSASRQSQEVFLRDIMEKGLVARVKATEAREELYAYRRKQIEAGH